MVPDERIVDLYWQRDESAIQATEEKYGRYLMKIARNILADLEDSRESVNDTYLGAWNSMPPHRPNILSAYLAKLTRRISISRYRKRASKKRRASEYALSLEELADCVPAGETPEQAVEARELAAAIASYLAALPARSRGAFLQRYYYLDPVRDIAACYGMGTSRMEGVLYRVRKGLKAHLEKEGFHL